MTAGSRSIAFAAAVALSLGLAGVTRAQPSAGAAATLQFDKGRALMKEKKYAEACAAFEQSQKLDPQIGTLYNLGVCHAQLGKIASAWTAYREVGQRDTNPSRKKEANRRARELEKRLPKLLLTIDAAPPGLAVTMNGVDVTALVGTDSPVDPAEYKLKATAPGHAAWQTVAKITDEGETVTLAIELERSGKDAGRSPASPGEEPAPAPGGDGGDGARDDRQIAPGPDPAVLARQRRKVLALAFGVTGVTSLTTALVFGNLARSSWNSATLLCGEDRVCDDGASLALGNQLVSDARTYANVSTVLVVGGATLVGVGAVLWLTAPSGKRSSETALRLTPQLGRGHAGVTLGGRFP